MLSLREHLRQWRDHYGATSPRQMWQPSGTYLTATQELQVNDRRLAAVHRMWRLGKGSMPFAHMYCQVNLGGKTSKLDAELKDIKKIRVALRGARTFF